MLFTFPIANICFELWMTSRTIMFYPFDKVYVAFQHTRSFAVMPEITFENLGTVPPYPPYFEVRDETKWYFARRDGRTLAEWLDGHYSIGPYDTCAEAYNAISQFDHPLKYLEYVEEAHRLYFAYNSSRADWFFVEFDNLSELDKIPWIMAAQDADYRAADKARQLLDK